MAAQEAGDQPPAPRQILTTKDLAARYRLAPGTIENWRVAGKGPPFLRFGGKHAPVRYRLEDVEAWEKTQRKGAAA